MPVGLIYPDWEVGDLVTADMLTSMQPATLVKAGTSTRTSTITPTVDNELQGLTLGIGTWRIELVAFFNDVGASGFKTAWAFSGTWNNPVRGTIGPGTSNVAGPGAVTEANIAALAASSNLGYGLGASSTYAMVREITYTAVVTVAGDLSLLWSQNTSVASASTLQPGSTFEVRQIG